MFSTVDENTREIKSTGTSKVIYQEVFFLCIFLKEKI